MEKNKKIKIGIFHYRVGKTDGVSLEIEKRREILIKHNCDVRLIAGPNSVGADYIIKELEWDSLEMAIIKESSFKTPSKKILTSDKLSRKINKIAKKIKDRLEIIQKKESFDYILVHNVFSFGGHIPASKAFLEWIEENKIRCLATSHDFYWEKKEFQTPRNKFIEKYLQKYMPPKSKYIQHIVINSIAEKKVKKKNDIDAMVIGDIFDFNQKKWGRDNLNKEFLKQFKINDNDIVVLQATRIIPRKGIEIAIEYTRELQLRIKSLTKKSIYNGKKITKNSKVVLVIAGYAEKENKKYLAKLKKIAIKKNISVQFIADYISAEREFSKNGKLKKFSLWDAYTHADLITYPSLWEGWGNQFIEAIFAKKPIAVFEYPVFKSDIKKEGYNIVSFGDKFIVNKKTGEVSVPKGAMKKAVDRTISNLLSKQLNKKRINQNFKIGKKYHNYDILEKFLLSIIDDINIKKTEGI